MKPRFYLLILLASIIVPAGAQSDTQTKVYQKDIGFNTTFILQGILNSSQTDFAVMFKKYKAEKRALRIGASAIYDTDKGSNFPPSTTYSSSSTSRASFSLGKEWQTWISQKWVWYYGGDIIPDAYHSESTYFSSAGMTDKNSTFTIGLKARPFLGIRYNINDRLYLSAEASIFAGHSWSTTKSEGLRPGNEFTANIKSNSSNFYAAPASGIFLFYRF